MDKNKNKNENNNDDINDSNDIYSATVTSWII